MDKKIAAEILKGIVSPESSEKIQLTNYTISPNTDTSLVAAKHFGNDSNILGLTIIENCKTTSSESCQVVTATATPTSFIADELAFVNFKSTEIPVYASTMMPYPTKVRTIIHRLEETNQLLILYV